MDKVRVYTETGELTIVSDEEGRLKCGKWPHCEKLSLSGLNCLSRKTIAGFTVKE